MQSFRDQILAFIPKEEAALATGKITPHLPDGLHMGCNLRYKRWLIAAEYSIQRHPGDLVEIGVLGGINTLRLAKLANRYGRRVIAVDPWVWNHDYKAWGGCTETTRAEFYARMKNYLHIVDVLDDYSQSERVISFIKAREICFGLIDGAHFYGPCKNDIETLWHCTGIIALDDLWIEGVKRAFLEAGEKPGREAFYHNRLSEGYLLRGEE
jgi:hypothetical protein